MSTHSYEQEIARRLGVRHVIAFAYARHALIAILEAAGLQRGDDGVEVGMVEHVAPPGVQDEGEAQLGTEAVGIGGKAVQGCGDRGEQQARRPQAMRHEFHPEEAREGRSHD
jgi:hypothetical protein